MKNGNNRRKRMRLIPRQSTGMRQRNLMITSIALLIVVGTATIYFNLGTSHKTYAAAAGDYRSTASGNWNATAIWEKYNGSAWVAATATPTSSDGEITILTGHTVTIADNVTADQVIVNSGGQITLNSGRTLTLANGTGSDLDVSGIFKSAGTVTINAGSTIVYQSIGKYQHNFTTTAGTIPTATWNTGSTCEVIGYTTNTSTPAGLQSFYNFTWNCPSQAGIISLNGGLTTVNGNFSVINTGTNELRLSTGSTNLTIGGDYIQSGGTFSTVNSNGNKDTLFLAGNYSQTGGTIMNRGNANSRTRILFNGTGSIKTFVKSGTAVINAVGSSKVCFEVVNGTTLNLANYIVEGYDFTVNNGAGLIIGSANGIASAGAIGNVQGIGTRTFNTGADYTYNGSSAQVTGNGLPSTVRNLTINNSNHVTLTNDVSVSTGLNLTRGKIITANEEIYITTTSSLAIASHSDSSYVHGKLRRSVGLTGVYDFPVGSSDHYELLTLTLASNVGISNMYSTFVSGDPAPNGVNDCHANGNANAHSGLQINNKYFDDMLDNGYWELTPNNPLGIALYSVEVSASGQTNQTQTDPSDFVLLKRHASNNNWEIPGVPDLVGQLVQAARVTVKATGLTSFSHFGAGQSGGGSALPIELISFIVKQKDDVVDIKWSTAAEKNNDYFSIERSADGKTFEVIEKVDGAGNSNTVLNYRTTDDSPLPGKSYYRLKQTDFNGDFTYSPVRVINLNGESSLQKEVIEIKSVAPNPFTNQFSVTYNLETAGEVQIMLISIKLCF